MMMMMNSLSNNHLHPNNDDTRGEDLLSPVTLLNDNSGGFPINISTLTSDSGVEYLEECVNSLILYSALTKHDTNGKFSEAVGVKVTFFDIDAPKTPETAVENVNYTEALKVIEKYILERNSQRLFSSELTFTYKKCAKTMKKTFRIVHYFKKSARKDAKTWFQSLTLTY